MSPFLTVRFEGEGVPEVLRAAKREVKQRMKDGMLSAAEEEIFPRLEETAPAIIREALVIKGGVRGPKVTTRGPRKFDRITGLLNFGGNVVSPIAPKVKSGHQELSIGNGIFRARVTKPRHYRGKEFIERGIELGFPSFEERVLESVMASFNGIPHTP